MTNIAIENHHRNIVNFPMNSMVIFHSKMWNYQRVSLSQKIISRIDFQKATLHTSGGQSLWHSEIPIPYRWLYIPLNPRKNINKYIYIYIYIYTYIYTSIYILSYKISKKILGIVWMNMPQSLSPSKNYSPIPIMSLPPPRVGRAPNNCWLTQWKSLEMVKQQGKNRWLVKHLWYLIIHSICHHVYSMVSWCVMDIENVAM